jgi:tetratricopeptide (TPR) repeat protein
MNQQLGRGLGALLSDRSTSTIDTSDRYRTIRDKERKLEELQVQIDEESKSLEDLRKRLTIELMLNGKVDKTDLFKMEEELNKKVKVKDTLVKEIDTLKNEVRNYVAVDAGSGGPGTRNNNISSPQIDDLSHEIDIRLVRELMPPTEEVPDAEPHDDEEHIQGLKDELDRGKQVEEVRREAYGDDQPPTTPPPVGPPVKKRVRRIVSPKRVRVIRGTARPISKGRDNRMYELMESALGRMGDGDLKGARKGLERILSEYPNDDEVLYHLGNTYFMEDNWTDAEALYRKAIEKNPRSYRALNNLGMVLQKQGNKEAAIMLFNQTLELNQQYERAWLNLGSIFMIIEPPMLKEASIFLRRALELQPTLKIARDKLEECESRLNST